MCGEHKRLDGTGSLVVDLGDWIWGCFSLVPGTELHKPLEFPEWRSALVMLMRWIVVDPSLASRWILVTRETRHVIRRLEPWTNSPSEEGRGLEIEFNHVANDWISYAWVIKCQQKLCPLKLSGASWLKNTLMCWHGDVLDSTGEGHRGSDTLPDPALCGPSVINCNCNLAISGVLWVVPVNYWTWGGPGNPQICNNFVRHVGGLGTPETCVWKLE